MRLFIDDERDLPGDDVTTVRTSADALAMLEQTVTPFTHIYFDHDLGGEDTTIPVVDWLSERAFNGNPYPAQMVVHTANPVGRDTIMRCLQRWGYDCRVWSATTWNHSA